MMVRFPAFFRLLALALIAALVVPATGLARPAAPAEIAVVGGADPSEELDPENPVDIADLPHTIRVRWSMGAGVGAYEIRSADGAWSYRCAVTTETFAPGDPRVPAIAGLPVDVRFDPVFGYATWRLPLGPTAGRDGTVTVFPEGATTVQVRALPRLDSPGSDASDPATVTLSWFEQPTSSSIGVVPTPWGVRVTRSTTAVGPGEVRELTGRFEASLDGTVYRPVEQRFRSTTGRVTWFAMTYPVPGMSQLVLGADPTVWPRFDYIVEDHWADGVVRIGASVFDPRTRSVRYRQTHTPEIQEIPYDSGVFYRFGASSAVRSYTPKAPPRLSQVSVTGMQRGTNVRTGTITKTAAGAGKVRWKLYRRVAGATSRTLPSKAWTLRASGTAGYSPISAALTRYRIAVPVSTAGTYRLDVTYDGSSVARPDGYSKTFTVR